MSTILRSYKYLSLINNKSKVLSKRLFSIHSSIALPIVRARDNVAFKQKTSMHFRTYSVRMAQLEVDSSIPPRQNTENINDISLVDQKLNKLDSDVRSMGRLHQREVEAIVTLVKRMGNVSSTHGLLLVKACGSLIPEMSKEKRRQLAEEVWDTLLKQKCPLDVSHYNALLRVHLDNENQLDPIEFLSMMQRNGIEPNRVIHQRLLSHYCQNGDMNGASQILEFMKLKDFPMNEFIFNDLIMGNVRANNVEDGKNIIGVMRDANLPITSSTYTSLACGYATLGDITNVLATIQEASAQEASLLDKDILKIIYTLAVSKHSHLVEQVIPLIQCKAGYTPDCIITILELINKGFHEVGFALLKTMPETKSVDGSASPSGMFFIRQLVKQDVDPDVIKDYCNQMKDLGINNLGLFKATEMALYFKKTDAAINFLKEMHSQGSEMRPHFFWPILACKRENEKDVYDVLKLMMDLGCPADNDTFTAHVFPYMDPSDTNSIVNQLKAIGYEDKDFTQSLILFLIQNGEMQRSAELLEQHSIETTPLLSLSKGFIKSQDEVSTVQILQNFERSFSYQTRVNKFNNIYGEFLYHFAISKEFSVSLLKKLLLLMEEKGVKMDASHTTLQIILRNVDTGSRVEISNLLKKLSSSGIPDMQVKYSAVNKSADKLLLQYAMEKNLAEVQKILKVLDEQNFIYHGHHYAALIELHNFHSDLEKALYYKAVLDQEFPEFPIKEHTIINLATSLVQNKKIDDAESLLSSHYAKHGCQEEPSYILRNILNLMKSLADSEEPHRAMTFIETLINYGYCKPERILLQPLIQAYLASNQINKAVEEFLRCVAMYKCSPATVDLFVQLILQKDTVNLQKVTDAAISIHGEANVLVELVMAFIECNQLEQAKKVAETSGLRVRMDRIAGICKYYTARDKSKELELFIQVTKNVFGLNRDTMYYNLLQAYVKEENVDRALGVWEQMQEEDVQPSDQTLHLLGTFLQKMNRAVPFTIPPAPSNNTKSRIEVVKEVLGKTKIEYPFQQHQREELDDKSIRASDVSKTIRALLDQDHLKEALKLSDNLLESGSHPNRDVARYLALKLTKAGDKDSLLKLQEKLPEVIAKKIPFKSLIAGAYISSDGPDGFLRSLEDEMFKYKENFPGGALLHLLSEQPETLERVKKLVDVYYQEGLSIPRNMLWIHLMKKHNFEEAKKLFEETPEMSANLLFKSVIKAARDTSDVKLSQELLDQTKISTLAVSAKGVIFANHVGLLLANKKVDEALSTLKELQTIMSLDDLSYSTRVYLLRKFQVAGVTVPFVLPQSVEDSSSSSSSSDDEKK